MFGLSKLYLYAALVAAWALSVVGVGYWQRLDGRADLAREIAAAAAEKRLADIEEKERIEDALESTPDAGLVDLIINGGWLREEN
jgi:hypothetical protein